MLDNFRRVVVNIDSTAEEILLAIRPKLKYPPVDAHIFYDTIIESMSAYFNQTNTLPDETQLLIDLSEQLPTDIFKSVLYKIDSIVSDMIELRIKDDTLRTKHPATIYTVTGTGTVILNWW